MKLTSVHHIAVINSNYEKSYDFYVNRLGRCTTRKVTIPLRP